MSSSKTDQSLNWCAVVPLANEEVDFDKFIDALTTVLDSIGSGRAYLVVDNASRDKTLGLSRALSARDSRYVTVWAPENKNVVDAYLRGFREALAQGHEYIIEMDAGLSHDPAVIPKFLQGLVDGNDCVFSSRYIDGGSNSDSPLFRRILSRGGTIAAQVLLGARLTDMTSGFEGFRRDALARLVAYPLLSKGHFYQTEVRHLLRNTRWIEVPIHYRAPSPRVSNNSIRNSVDVLLHYFSKRISGSSPSV